MAIQFDEIKERLKSEWTQTTDRLEESSIYNQIKDKYENLSPLGQKASLFGLIGVVVFVILSIPMGYYSDSASRVEEFDSNRSLIRDLFKSSKDGQEIPNIPRPPAPEELSRQIDDQLKAAQLLPEQMKGIEVTQDKIKGVNPDLIQGGVKVNLAKLNLRQVIDLGYQMQAVSPSIKMSDLHIEANLQDSRYFDVIYKFIVMNVPDLTQATSDIEDDGEKKAAPKPPARRGRTR
ncbi:MAG: hypothetical protein BroJett040_15480 [Oligoflexia bacterium]|nr:MAG: hypothetical protein BroJett040_15480 [Oligoflexia bacterium]